MLRRDAAKAERYSNIVPQYGGQSGHGCCRSSRRPLTMRMLLMTVMAALERPGEFKDAFIPVYDQTATPAELIAIFAKRNGVNARHACRLILLLHSLKMHSL